MLTFKNRQALIAHCLKSGKSLYQNLHLPSDELEWQKLPPLTKDALIATPFAQRIFIPQSEIDHVRPSSGTSGKPPLFSPRTPLRNVEYRAQYHDFKGAMLAFGVPAMPHWHEQFQKKLGHEPNVVVFDPKYPEVSVRLAAEAGVTSLSVFAFHIPLIGEHMKRLGIASHITFIEIAGEACTKLLFNFMRETFPNATIIPFYGASEVEDSPIGVPCRPITGEEPLSVYHGKTSHYLELIDPESGEALPPTPHMEGELVITAYPGEPSALPLIRFRTGDMVRVVESACAHEGFAFTVLGRVHIDFLKVPGGVVRADEIERVLRTLELSDRFEAHCIEHSTPAGPRLELQLFVEAPQENLEVLAQEIAEKFRVGPTFTYAQGMAQGVYLPLRCISFKSEEGKKQKRLLRR